MIFRKQLREGKDDSVESLILEVVDKMDQVYEAFAEFQRGNTEEAALKAEQCERRLDGFRLMSIVKLLR